MASTLRRLLFPLVLLAYAAGIAREGQTLEAVRVELLPGSEDPVDGGLFGVGGGDPDYQLLVVLETRTEDCGTQQDTPIGEGLRFQVPGSPPLAFLTGLRLVEDDTAEDDLLEELDLVETPASGGVVEGQGYRFVFETGWSVFAGIESFMETIFGLVLGMVLVMLVISKAGALAMLTHIED